MYLINLSFYNNKQLAITDNYMLNCCNICSEVRTELYFKYYYNKTENNNIFILHQKCNKVEFQLNICLYTCTTNISWEKQYSLYSGETLGKRRTFENL